MRSRTFVVTFFISFLLLTAALSLFNYSIDAACLYSRTQVVKRVANDLLAGKTIAGQPAFQYRYFQKLIVEKRRGIPDTIVDGKSGLLFEPENIEDLASKIIRLLTDEGLREEMGNAAREKARECDWARIAERTVEVYRDIISNLDK